MGAAGPAGAQTTPPSTPGSYEVGLSTRTFDAPLFGSDSATTYRFFGTQSFGDAGDFRAWLSGGFTGYSLFYGVVGERIPAGDGLLRVEAGDFLVRSLQPDSIRHSLTESFALQGASVLYSGDGFQCSAFAGTSRFTVGLPTGGETRSELYGGECLSRKGKTSFGAGMTVVGDPVRVSGDSRSGPAILSGRLYQEVTPWITLFGEGHHAGEGKVGFRAGTHLRFQRGGFSSFAYSFDEAFPFVYPLYRPGEEGIELRGDWEPWRQGSVHGSLTRTTDNPFQDRDELRGHVGLGVGFGSNRPRLTLDYSYNDIVFDTLSGTPETFLGRRLSLGVNQYSSIGFLGFTLDRTMSRPESTFDRTQGTLVLRRAVGPRGFLDASVLAQREDVTGDRGITMESALELPLAGPYSYLVGVGGALLERGGAHSGEGVLRVGLSRRLVESGWYARLEMRLPFRIDMPRSELNRQVLALDIGNRFNWSDVSEIGSLFRKNGTRRGEGVIEGRVVFEGEGVGGVGVLVGGTRRGTTRRDGRFVIRGVAAGDVRVALDLRNLEPGYEIAGGSSILVTLPARQTARVEFEIGRFSSFQGALVRCAGDGGERLEPLKGARLWLSGGEFNDQVHSTVSGSFQFHRVPPGVYELVVEETSSGAAARPAFEVRIDESIFGEVIRIDCPDGRVDPRSPIQPAR